MTPSRFTRKSLAFLMGLALLFTCFLPASAAPSDGVVLPQGSVDSDGAAAMEPAASAATGSGGAVDLPDALLPSDGNAENAGTEGHIELTLVEDSDGVITIRNANGYIDDGRQAPAVDENSLSVLLGTPLPTPPSSYSLKDQQKMTGVRNQNPYGSCWAHAALASAESNLLMQNAGTYDFSELHLVHYTYHRNADVAAILGTSGDIVKHLDTSLGDINRTSNTLMFGGNDEGAVSTLASGLGPIAEEKLPYPPMATASGVLENVNAPTEHALQVINGSLNAGDFAVSQNAAQFDYAYTVNPKSNPTLVKQLLMTSGAASISYCDTQVYNTSVSPYAYYCPTAYTANHAVTLCGWNDNYPKGNFPANPTQPKANGAWLCKNSWGAGRLYVENGYYTLWGDGYFWISYEDATLTDAVFYGMKPLEEGSDYLYQHDGGNYSYWAQTAYGANVFTSVHDAEQLDAVRVGLNSANNTVTIKAYSDLASSSQPTKGTLIASATHNCPYAGTYTLPFDSPAILPSGKAFSVVVQVQSSNPCILFDFPYSSSLDGARSSSPTYSGKSFVSNDGSTWSSLPFTLRIMSAATGQSHTETATVDLRIKALTSKPGYKSTGVYGDVNANQKLDLGDAVMTARCAAGFLKLVQSKNEMLDQFGVADVFPQNEEGTDAYTKYGEYGDGLIKVTDVITLCQKLARF